MTGPRRSLLARLGRRRSVAGLMALAALLGGWVWQVLLFDGLSATLKESIGRLEEARAQAGAAAKRSKQLEDEAARIDADLIRLRQFLPRAFDVPAFARGVEATYGVEVLVVDERPGATGTFQSRDVSVVLFGPRSLTSRVPPTGRLVRSLPLFWWEAEEARDGEVEGVFTLFARPAEAVAPPLPAWAEAGDDVFLWPYGSRLAALRARRDGLLSELRKDEGILRRVRLFEAGKAELSACVDIINGLLQDSESDPPGR